MARFPAVGGVGGMAVVVVVVVVEMWRDGIEELGAVGAHGIAG